MMILTIYLDVSPCHSIAALMILSVLMSRHSEVDPSRPESVVERMALPRIRGGTGPVKVDASGFEG